MEMSKANFQKNVGLVIVMSNRGDSIEAITRKTGFSEDEIKHWRAVGEKHKKY